MKSKELENPASSPEKEQLPVTGVDNEETGVTSEPIVNNEEVINEELVIIEEQKPQTARSTEEETIATEPFHEKESELTDAIL